MVNIVRDVKKAFNWGVDATKKVFSSNPLGLKKTTSFVMPISPASNTKTIISTSGNIAKSLYQGIKTFATKKTFNPAAGEKGIKNIGRALGSAVAVAGMTGGLYGAGKLTTSSIMTGKTPTASQTFKTISKTAGIGAGIGISPVGGAIGLLEGGGIATGQAAKNTINKLLGLGQSRIEDATKVFKMPEMTMPTTPQITNNFSIPEGFNTSFPSGSSLFPQPITNITIPSTGGGGFSVNMPSSGMENLPLMLMLMAGGIGAGGYLLGKRKKRKRKKYKKKKSH